MEAEWAFNSKRNKLTHLVHMNDEGVRAAQPQVQDLPLRVLHRWRGASDELPQWWWLLVVARYNAPSVALLRTYIEHVTDRQHRLHGCSLKISAAAAFKIHTLYMSTWNAN